MPKKYDSGAKFTKCASDGRVFAKVVDGRLLYAHKINTNSFESLDSWKEYATVEEASKLLGVPAPKNAGCPILNKKHSPINWSKYKGGYYIPFSTLDK